MPETPVPASTNPTSYPTRLGPIHPWLAQVECPNKGLGAALLPGRDEPDNSAYQELGIDPTERRRRRHCRWFPRV